MKLKSIVLKYIPEGMYPIEQVPSKYYQFEYCSIPTSSIQYRDTVIRVATYSDYIRFDERFPIGVLQINSKQEEDFIKSLLNQIPNRKIYADKDWHIEIARFEFENLLQQLINCLDKNRNVTFNLSEMIRWVERIQADRYVSDDLAKEIITELKFCHGRNKKEDPNQLDTDSFINEFEMIGFKFKS